MVILGFQIPARHIHTDKIKTGFPIILWLVMTKKRFSMDPSDSIFTSQSGARSVHGLGWGKEAKVSRAPLSSSPRREVLLGGAES
jgi:hypothetical protein